MDDPSRGQQPQCALRKTQGNSQLIRKTLRIFFNIFVSSPINTFILTTLSVHLILKGQRRALHSVVWQNSLKSTCSICEIPFTPFPHPQRFCSLSEITSFCFPAAPAHLTGRKGLQFPPSHTAWEIPKRPEVTGLSVPAEEITLNLWKRGL